MKKKEVETICQSKKEVRSYASAGVKTSTHSSDQNNEGRRSTKVGEDGKSCKSSPEILSHFTKQISYKENPYEKRESESEDKSLHAKSLQDFSDLALLINHNVLIVRNGKEIIVNTVMLLTDEPVLRILNLRKIFHARNNYLGDNTTK